MKLTGRIAIRHGFNNKIVVRVEYRTEANEFGEKETRWRDATQQDMIALNYSAIQLVKKVPVIS